MINNRLETRSPLLVAIGYFIGAFGGGIAFGLEQLFQMSSDRAAAVLTPGEALDACVGSSVLAGLVCAAVEVVLITPLLIGFHRYRWKWLNGWTGALIGFVLAALPAFLIGATPNADGTSQILGYYAGGQLTAAGLRHAFANAGWIGPVGVVSAISFRLVAVRKVSLN